jgi:hypothetical protein
MPHLTLTSSSALVDLDRSIDLSVEPVTRIKSNSSGDEEEGQGHDAHISKVDQRRQKLIDHIKLGQIIPDRVEESVAGT